MASVLPVKWEDEALKRFYRAYHKHGTGNWSKASAQVAGCLSLQRKFAAHLSLHSSQAHAICT
jgi:hypothetical protein